MTPQKFRALVTEQGPGEQFSRRIVERDLDELPAGELLVKVRYSSLNYKDALSALGHPGVTKQYPHTPGIDAAGVVVSCTDGAFSPGEQVIVTGYDLGMNTPGGYGEYIRVPSSWALRLPAGLTLKESMIIGTAGLTAGLSLYRLAAAGVVPESGEVLVTGATGGVGSLAVCILAKAGYRVAAVTGKSSQSDFLGSLGAASVLSREELLRGADRPLMKERWSGVLDMVGGELLSAAIRSTRYGGAVTCCGLAASPELPLNVFPFILRAVSLIGIDSAQCPQTVRQEVWQRLAGPWRPEYLLESAAEVALSGLEERFHAILKGELRGRTVVEVSGA
jgi:putative YhdH/YhfP family quinone oxidoreductase